MPITWNFADQGSIIDWEEVHEHSPVEQRLGPGTGNPVVRVLQYDPARLPLVAPGATLTDLCLSILGFATYTPGGARTLSRRLPMVDPADMPFLGARPARVATEILAIQGVGSDGHSVYWGDPPGPGLPRPALIRGQSFTNPDSRYRITVRYQHVPYVWKLDAAVGANYEAERYLTRARQSSLEYYRESGAGWHFAAEAGVAGGGTNWHGQPDYPGSNFLGNNLGRPSPVSELTITLKAWPAAGINFPALLTYEGCCNQASVTLTTNFGPVVYEAESLLYRGFNLVEDFFADGVPMADVVLKFGVRPSWLRGPEPAGKTLRLLQKVGNGAGFVPKAQLLELFRGPNLTPPPPPIP
jgi:hypothetical protein